MTIIERLGDQYRLWSTVSDTYVCEPHTRNGMGVLLAERGANARGWTTDDITRVLDDAVIVDAWAEGGEQ